MKKVWGMITAVWLAFSAGTLTGCKSSARYDRYANADLYEVGSAFFAAEQIREIELNWLGGSVEIEQNATDVIEIIEDEGITNEEERMHYCLIGGTLKVQYCAAGIRVQDADKNLHISLPAGIALDIDCLSSRVNVLDSLTVSRFSLECTSGNLEAERLFCTGETDVETESGSVEVMELTTQTLSIETESGDISVEKLSTEQAEIETEGGDIHVGVGSAFAGEIESNGGDIKIKLPEGMGAGITFETVSGEFNSVKLFTKTGKEYSLSAEEGKNSCTMRIQTFSGNLTVE